MTRLTIFLHGNFTQLIWKNSQKFGAGRAQSKSGKWYVVANYDPAGNYIGNFNDNVPALALKASSSKDLRAKETKPDGVDAPRTPQPKEEAKQETAAKKSLRRRKSSSSSSSSEDEEEKKFAEECLKHHNIKRKEHGVPPLVMDKKLKSLSKEWARTLANDELLRHRPPRDPPVGENAYFKFNSSKGYVLNGKEAVEDWYSEIVKYKMFGQEPNSIEGCGHFTQVIWADSKKFGVGRAKSKSGKWFVVANYEPAGNYMGQFKQNVRPPKSAKSGEKGTKKP